MESSSDDDSSLQEQQNPASVLDVEDLGAIMNRAKKAKVRSRCNQTVLVGSDCPIMGRSVVLTRPLRAGAVTMLLTC